MNTKQTNNVVIAFLTGIMAGVAITFFLESERKQRRLIQRKQVRENLNFGNNLDYNNLQNDWNSINGDINKSFEKLKFNF